MKIDSFSYIFRGLDQTSDYAAATSGKSFVWGVAAGSKPGAATTVIHSFENLEIDEGTSLNENAEFMAFFDKIHLVMKEINAIVSVAGAYSDGHNLRMFSIGNARALLFQGGNLIKHSDDDNEAYLSFQNSEMENLMLYDQIRGMKNHINLKKALGYGNNGRPKLYDPVPLQKDIALLLCTEPFWRYPSVIEMELDYRKSADSKEWLNIMTKRVLMKSNKEIDNENFAALALMVQG